MRATLTSRRDHNFRVKKTGKREINATEWIHDLVPVRKNRNFHHSRFTNQSPHKFTQYRVWDWTNHWPEYAPHHSWILLNPSQKLVLTSIRNSHKCTNNRVCNSELCSNTGSSTSTVRWIPTIRILRFILPLYRNFGPKGTSIVGWVCPNVWTRCAAV